MEKRLIISFLLVFIFSLNAEVRKGTFSIAGIKIESPAQNEIVLEEESYLIDENDLFRCVYKMHNKGGKCNVSFSLNVTAASQEEGLNYCETLIPEDFAILVDGTNSDFSYKNEDAVLNGQDIFKRGIYEHGTTGGIIFSLEMKPNELKTIEIDYSINPQGSYKVNFAQNIKHSPGYKRKISIHNKKEFYISRITAYKDGNPPGYNAKLILDIYNNYIDSSEIVFERREKELVLNFTESNFVRIWIKLSVFMDCHPAANYQFRSGSIEFDSIPEIVLSQTVIPKLNLYFLSNRQLWLLRNSFYALHGHAFKNPELYEFFLENLEGYRDLMKQGFNENSFNEIEWKNIELIRELENMKEPVLLTDYLK